jgi:hypothetical protein
MARAIKRLGFTVGTGKPWAARITGRSARYGFAREFAPVVDRHSSRSGASGWVDVALEGEPGTIFELHDERGRRFVRLNADGSLTRVEAAEVLEAVS